LAPARGVPDRARLLAAGCAPGRLRGPVGSPATLC